MEAVAVALAHHRLRAPRQGAVGVRVGVEAARGGEGVLGARVGRVRPEHGLVDRGQHDRHARRHGLDDGAPEALHPARLGVVDEHVDVGEEVAGGAGVEALHAPVARQVPEDLGRRLRAAQHVDLDVGRLGVDLQDPLRGFGPFERVVARVPPDPHRLARCPSRAAAEAAVPVGHVHDVDPVLRAQVDGVELVGMVLVQRLAHQGADGVPLAGAAERRSQVGLGPGQLVAPPAAGAVVAHGGLVDDHLDAARLDARQVALGVAQHGRVAHDQEVAGDVLAEAQHRHGLAVDLVAHHRERVHPPRLGQVVAVHLDEAGGEPGGALGADLLHAGLDRAAHHPQLGGDHHVVVPRHAAPRLGPHDHGHRKGA